MQLCTVSDMCEQDIELTIFDASSGCGCEDRCLRRTRAKKDGVGSSETTVASYQTSRC